MVTLSSIDLEVQGRFYKALLRELYAKCRIPIKSKLCVITTHQLNMLIMKSIRLRATTQFNAQAHTLHTYSNVSNGIFYKLFI